MLQILIIKEDKESFQDQSTSKYFSNAYTLPHIAHSPSPTTPNITLQTHIS